MIVPCVWIQLGRAVYAMACLAVLCFTKKADKRLLLRTGGRTRLGSSNDRNGVIGLGPSAGSCKN